MEKSESCPVPERICPLTDTRNGWERWRGRMEDALDRIERKLNEDGSTATSERHEMIDRLDNVDIKLTETRGLANRALFISIGAWSAIGLILFWLIEHLKGGG